MAQLMAKDAGLARKLAESKGFPTPVLDQALAAYDDALEAGLGKEDFSAVMKLYEKAAGKSLGEG
jgi:3-hydroxyisobutyrate dehydrogenase-like beta-hydroxyacid dehydrogenase